jgi:hypothetical protein
MPRTFCLVLHSGYRCRHSGVCCSTDWLIPAEPQVLHVVTALNVSSIDGVGPLFVSTGSNGAAAVGRRADRTCVFYDREGSHLCAIHSAAGANALPSACRHFPREILQDPRGTFISLSHFCPTAADLLLTSDPARALAVIEAPTSLRLDDPVEGLDALDALPPLVRPGLLGDYEGYDAWERAGLATLARADRTYRQAIDLIGAATEDIRSWEPGAGTLGGRVHAAFARAVPALGLNLRKPDARAEFAELASACFPPSAAPVPEFEDVWRKMIEPSLATFDFAIRNYLAARLFGNWIAHQGRGWRTIVGWLRTVLAVVENEMARRCLVSERPLTAADLAAAAGAADLLLLHTVDSEILARHFAPVEGPEPT